MITPIKPQTPRHVAAHYDDLDQFYRDTWGRHVHHGCWERGDETPEEAVAHLTQNVASKLNLPSENARILDIGCG